MDSPPTPGHAERVKGALRFEGVLRQADRARDRWRCPMCGVKALRPEHAHERCDACGWRGACCW